MPHLPIYVIPASQTDPALLQRRAVYPLHINYILNIELISNTPQVQLLASLGHHWSVLKRENIPPLSGKNKCWHARFLAGLLLFFSFFSPMKMISTSHEETWSQSKRSFNWFQCYFLVSRPRSLEYTYSQLLEKIWQNAAVNYQIILFIHITFHT